MGYKAIGTGVGGVGAINVAWPAGHAAGDYGVLAVETGAQALTEPSGWSLLGYAVGQGTTSRLTLFERFATSGAESDAAVPDSGDHQYGVIITFDSIDTSEPVVGIGGGSTGGSPTTIPLGPLYCPVDGCTVVDIATWASDSAGPFASAYTRAGLDTPTERFDAGTTHGNGGGIVIGTGTKTTAGFLESGSFTYSSGANSAQLSLVLQPPQTPAAADTKRAFTKAQLLGRVSSCA